MTGTTEGRVNAIERLMLEAVPGIGVDEARSLALEAAGGSHGLATLQWHLQNHRNALGSGDSDAPRVVLRLIKLLDHTGYDNVVVPACADCGAVERALLTPVQGGRVCRRCARLRAEACSRCKRVAAVYRRVEDGPICERCWRADPAATSTCALCGHIGPVSGQHRGSDGTSICKRCYQHSTLRCVVCGERRIAAAHLEEGPVCPRCHNGSLGCCDGCGEVRPIYTRLGQQGRSLCRDCARAGVFGRCSGCGAIGSVSRRRSRDRQPYCTECWSKGTCSRCGRERKIGAIWPIGAVCATCYAYTRRHPARCPACAVTQPLIGLDDAGTRICGPCAGVDVDYVCPGCGQAGHIASEGRCYACLAANRAHELLAGTDGNVRAELRPLLDALLGADSPDAVWQWIGEGTPAAGVLAQLVAAPGPLSHDLLDDLPQTLALHRMRQTLVHVGVLPARADYLERLVPWLEDRLADQSAQRAQLVRGYATWTVFRRARQRSQTSGRFTAGSADNARTKLRSTLRLLAWIDEQGLELDKVDQGDLDRWLVTQPRSTSGGAREFVGWARRAHLVGDIDIPKSRARSTLGPISEDDRWRHLKRCLSDDSLPLDARVAGALVLLYGIPVSRITALRADDVSRQGDRTYLNLGTHPLLLPPAVASLLDRQASQAISVTVLHRSNPTGPAWLFPGGFPGRPAHDVLYRKLRQHIPHIRRSRSAALINLAGDLPAPILADLLDLNINTAVQWTQHACRDWSHYLEARIGATTSTGRDKPDVGTKGNQPGNATP